VAELLTHVGVPEDEDVRARWHAVVDADPLGTFFHTPEYLALWAEVLGTRANVHVHEVVEDGQTIGIVPVSLQREGSPTGPLEVVRFLGGTDVTDYLGPVALPEHRRTVAGAYLDRLVEDADWDLFVAGGMVVGSGWDEHWLEVAAEHGMTTMGATEDDVCPRVDITGGFGAYLDGLPGKLRHELRRKARKLARDAGDLQLVEVAQDDIDEALTRFFDFSTEQGDDKARFFANEEMRHWFRELAAAFAPSGVFRLHELHVGGMPGAACVSLVHGDEWGLYNSAFDETLAMLAPGMVIVGELLEVAADEGCTTFDLLRGDEAYKYRFGSVDRELVTASFQRP
jgi:CelD/BcsL family acetyltransferase involved in cellulose biosynthesis